MTDLKSLLVRALSDARAAGSDDEQTANLLIARMEAAGFAIVAAGEPEEMAAIGMHVGYDKARAALSEARAETQMYAEWRDSVQARADALAEAAEHAESVFDDTETTLSGDLTGVGDLISAMDRLSRAARAYRSGGSGWMPIESAPKDGTPILGWRYDADYSPITGIEVFHWAARYNAWFLKCRAAFDPPTYWMPLPKPPTPETEDRDDG